MSTGDKGTATATKTKTAASSPRGSNTQIEVDEVWKSSPKCDGGPVGHEVAREVEDGDLEATTPQSDARPCQLCGWRHSRYTRSNVLST